MSTWEGFAEGVVLSARMEHQKRAYGEKEHFGLAGATANRMGAGAPVRALVQAGATEADAGMRHPWLPHTDNQHSFAGSQSRAQLGQNVRGTYTGARQDVAKAIAGKNSLNPVSRALSGTRAVRGLKQLGDAQHRMADISAHYDKPIEQGIASDALRKNMPHTGYGGMITGGVEHARGGLHTGGGTLSSHLDDLRPSASVADKHAVVRSGRMGHAFRSHVENDLVRTHGMSPAQAASASKEFFTHANPGRISRTLGEASRDAKYVASEGARAVRAVGGVAKTIGGKLLSKIR